MGHGKIITLLYPGEMGAAVGSVLVRKGHEVLWLDEGRSAETTKRALAAKLTRAESLGDALRQSQMVLSICPPQIADQVARAVAEQHFPGVFVEANAIAPERARRLSDLLRNAGADFVDASIVGPPPTTNSKTRLYLSGPHAASVAERFAGTPLDTIVLGNNVGSASALKCCNSLWSKGAVALAFTALATAEEEAVRDQLLDLWHTAQPDAASRVGKALGNLFKAWRWGPELDEVATALRSAGLPDGTMLGAAALFDRLSDFKGEPSPERIAKHLLKHRDKHAH